MSLLLDTNVVSELRKVESGKADAGVTAWVRGIHPADMHISAITLQELEYGVLRSEWRDPRMGALLRAWLDHRVFPLFADRLIPVDAAVARRAARLHVPNRKPWLDALIAATALVHGFAVVTRNVDDFAQTGVRVINPWAPTRRNELSGAPLQ